MPGWRAVRSSHSSRTRRAAIRRRPVDRFCRSPQAGLGRHDGHFRLAQPGHHLVIKFQMRVHELGWRQRHPGTQRDIGEVAALAPREIATASCRYSRRNAPWRRARRRRRAASSKDKGSCDALESGRPHAICRRASAILDYALIATRSPPATTAAMTRSSSKSSGPSIDRSCASSARARLTRLLIVPVGHPHIFAASS